MIKKLPLSFYRRTDTLTLAKELLGKILTTKIEGKLSSGKIVETEAYCGVTDKACHAYRGRRTKRTKIMYSPGGVAYIYLCYGIHHLFNVVCNTLDTPHAILVRAIEPVDGIELMLARRKMQSVQKRLTAGPGSLSQALGINAGSNGHSLLSDTIYILDKPSIPKEDIIASPRVGVGYAEEDALLPWRFRIRGNEWVSPAR